MKTKRIVPRGLFAALLLSGCSSQTKIVGTWVGHRDLPGKGETVRAEILFRANGTFHKKGGAEAEYSGTYAIQGDTLTETFTGYSVEGHLMSIPKDTPNVETNTFALKDDTLTLTPQGSHPQVFTRQKP